MFSFANKPPLQYGKASSSSERYISGRSSSGVSSTLNSCSSAVRMSFGSYCEMYLLNASFDPNNPASSAYRQKTRRTQRMFRLFCVFFAIGSLYCSRKRSWILPTSSPAFRESSISPVTFLTVLFSKKSSIENRSGNSDSWILTTLSSGFLVSMS